MSNDYTWPFDPSGKQPENLIKNESHTLSIGENKDYLMVIPKGAPFFERNLVIKHYPSGRTLINGVDFLLGHQFSAGTKAVGKNLWGSIFLLDNTLQGTLELTSYQSIGGKWTIDEATAATILSDSISNPRSINWDNVVNIPDNFPVIQHEFDLDDLVGLSDVVAKLEDLVEAVLLNSTAYGQHISQTNPHNISKVEVELGNVSNFGVATDAEALDPTVDNKYTTPKDLHLIMGDQLTGVDTTELSQITTTIKTVRANLDNLINNGVQYSDSLVDMDGVGLDNVGVTPKLLRMFIEDVMTATLGDYNNFYINSDAVLSSVTWTKNYIEGLKSNITATATDILEDDKWLTPRIADDILMAKTATELESTDTSLDNKFLTPKGLNFALGNRLDNLDVTKVAKILDDYDTILNPTINLTVENTYRAETMSLGWVENSNNWYYIVKNRAELDIVMNLMGQALYSSNDPNYLTEITHDGQTHSITLNNIVVSKVSDFSNLFEGKSNFNQNISNWDVSNAVTLNSAFKGCGRFNQNISNWDVRKVSDMFATFEGATNFNQDISGWKVDNVKDMGYMFNGATSFDQDLYGWNVSGIIEKSIMFDNNTPSWIKLGRQPSAWGIIRRNSDNIVRVVDDSIGWGKFEDQWFYIVKDKAELVSLLALMGDGGITNVTLGGESHDLSHDKIITTHITNMDGLFQDNVGFNGDITTWDVSNVMSMVNMFNGATSFNQSLSNWDVSNMLEQPLGFDTNTPSWEKEGRIPDGWGPLYRTTLNTVKAKDGLPAGWYVFEGKDWLVVDGNRQEFKDLVRGLASTITGDGLVTYEGVTKNININQLVTTKVTSMASLFRDNKVFNNNLNNWDVSNVFRMNHMFNGANKFNGDITNWDTVSLREANSMFRGATVFNRPLNNWDTSNLEVWVSMFHATPNFNQPLVNWDTSKANNDHSVFNGSGISEVNKPTFHFPLYGLYRTPKGTVAAGKLADPGWYVFEGKDWLVTPNSNNLKGIVNLFKSTAGVDVTKSVSYGGTTKVITLNQIVTSKVTDMSAMFANARNFNQDISNWDVSNVTNMGSMFNGASSFNQDISGWDVGNVIIMQSMFSGASSFNQDISGWDVGNVIIMQNMFYGATNFNQDISGWDVGNVTNMGSMFQEATNFNQDISNWDVSNVTDMYRLFRRTGNFNQDISNWDVSNVTNMHTMFYSNFGFNYDIGDWDVSSVTNMASMFANARNFNQDISGWDVSNVTNWNSFRSSSSLSLEHTPPKFR